jgi:Zn-dependent protease/predicted transcriptional regulator
MKGSLSLGKIFGIRVQIHWTFLLIIAWAVYVGWRQGGNTASVLWTIALVLAIFACVVLHELGHSLTARQYGIVTRKITLLPIGGVASLERMPEEPKQELLVAVMGPAVNVVIAGILYFFIRSQLNIFQQPEEAQKFFQTVTPENFLMYLFTTNIILVVFNAIPAFPMDGGRVLRALLSFRMDRVRATQIASNLGQVIAIFFFFIGFVYNPILIFIGLFVFFGASSEYMMIQQMSVLKGHKVREAMMSDYTVLNPGDTIDRVGKVLLSGTQRHFVVAREEAGVVGVLYNEDIAEAFQRQRNDLTVADIMDKDFKTMNPDEDLSEIYRTVQGRRHNFFPVMDRGELIGTIDMENINEFMMIRAALDY